MKIHDKAIAATSFAAAAAIGLALASSPISAASPPNLVGPGCQAYAQQVPTGPGSVAGMAADPVAVAASNNPQLTTLTAALSGKLNPQVNLVDTLDGGQFTVFAPTDAAFAKLDAATIDSLKTDPTADQDPHLPRGSRAAEPQPGRWHAQHLAGCAGDGDRIGGTDS